MLSLFSELYTINKYYVIFHREDTGHRDTGYRIQEYRDTTRYRIQRYRIQDTGTQVNTRILDIGYRGTNYRAQTIG